MFYSYSLFSVVWPTFANYQSGNRLAISVSGNLEESLSMSNICKWPGWKQTGNNSKWTLWKISFDVQHMTMTNMAGNINKVATLKTFLLISNICQWPGWKQICWPVTTYVLLGMSVIANFLVVFLELLQAWCFVMDNLSYAIVKTTEVTLALY